MKHHVSSCRTWSHVLSCHKMSAADWLMAARQSLTNHNQVVPLNLTSSSLIPAQLHCHSCPAAGNLPPPPQPPPFSPESKHGGGEWRSSWTNESCLLRPLGGFGTCSLSYLSCVANPGNIQSMEPSAPSITVFPFCPSSRAETYDEGIAHCSRLFNPSTVCIGHSEWIVIIHGHLLHNVNKR